MSPASPAAAFGVLDFDTPASAGTLAGALRDQGMAVAGPAALAALAGTPPEALATLAPHWETLAPDRHLKDGGRYRQRRHGCFVQSLADDAGLQPVPHRAHWQPTLYNALHGGMERWFEPLAPALADAPAFAALLTALGLLFAAVRVPQPPRWYIEAHPFRIDTAGGLGRPTPEGAHRDGVDFVAVILVGRRGLRGGETRVFEAEGAQGVRFTLDRPWSALLLDDPRVIHETTPILPLQPDRPGQRDTLVLTYRAGGFQSPESGA